MRAAVRETMERWLVAMVEAIDTGLECGDFTSDLPSDEIARCLAASYLGTDILKSLGLPAHSGNEIRTRL